MWQKLEKDIYLSEDDKEFKVEYISQPFSFNDKIYVSVIIKDVENFINIELSQLKIKKRPITATQSRRKF